jgi:hypothetical protein
MPTKPITDLTLAELMVDQDPTIYRNAMSIFKRLKARERAEYETNPETGDTAFPVEEQ